MGPVASPVRRQQYQATKNRRVVSLEDSNIVEARAGEEQLCLMCPSAYYSLHTPCTDIPATRNGRLESGWKPLGELVRCQPDGEWLQVSQMPQRERQSFGSAVF